MMHVVNDRGVDLCVFHRLDLILMSEDGPEIARRGARDQPCQRERFPRASMCTYGLR